MHKVDAAYLAGLVDGEGHLGIARYTLNNGHVQHKIQLAIGLTKPEGRDLLWSLKGKYGGSVHKAKKREGHAQDYRWYVTSKDALRPILKAILPYLRIKGKQAELLLAFLGTMQNTQGRKMPDSVFKKREQLCAAVKVLNRKESRT